MNNDLDIFGEYLTASLGVDEAELKEIPSLNPKLPPIYLFILRDYPDEDLTTFVTYGLSEMTQPTWHFGRPELLLCVESEKDAWGIGLAFIVDQFRGEKAFSHGSTYMLDRPVIDESGLSGFVIFKPSFLSLEESVFQLPTKTVYLSQAYPIYPGEAKMIEKQGFEAFWMDEGLRDVYDVQREDFSEPQS